jgi:hypothetical protein
MTLQMLLLQLSGSWLWIWRVATGRFPCITATSRHHSLLDRGCDNSEIFPLACTMLQQCLSSWWNPSCRALLMKPAWYSWLIWPLLTGHSNSKLIICQRCSRSSEGLALNSLPRSINCSRRKYSTWDILPEGMTMDSDRLKVVQEWLSQKDKYKLRSFLGLCIWHWRFIAGFADTVKRPSDQ